LILDIQGRLPFDIGPWTLRDLLKIDESKRIESWNHTAAICAQIANFAMRSKRLTKPFGVTDFHPFAIHRRRTKRPNRDAHIDTFIRHWTGQIVAGSSTAGGPPATSRL
jgi:hypothetical protein